ncbi:hypothetical protein FBQ97_15930 [Acidobacteria bacterium ACD]|nr:hypothetical protein [Acidobacteria bacterium ACD]
MVEIMTVEKGMRGALTFAVVNDGDRPLFLFQTPGMGGFVRGCVIQATDNVDSIAHLRDPHFLPRFIRIEVGERRLFDWHVDWSTAKGAAGCQELSVSLTVAGFPRNPEAELKSMSGAEKKEYLRRNQLLFSAKTDRAPVKTTGP